MFSQVGCSCFGPKDMALIMSARGVSLCWREAVDTHDLSSLPTWPVA